MRAARFSLFTRERQRTERLLLFTTSESYQGWVIQNTHVTGLNKHKNCRCNHNSPTLYRDPQMKNAMQVKPAHGEFQCKLFVGMIPHTCTASEIESIFAPFGAIVELNLLKRRSRILNKGCAFIQFKYKHQALKAIEELHGKHVIEVRDEWHWEVIWESLSNVGLFERYNSNPTSYRTATKNINTVQGSDTPLVVKFADNRKAKKTATRGRWRIPHYLFYSSISTFLYTINILFMSDTLFHRLFFIQFWYFIHDQYIIHE